MKIVSPLLKRVIYPTLSAAGVFHRVSAAGLAIVTYHGLLPPGHKQVDAGFDGNLLSSEILRRQLRLLKGHYNVISPEDALAWLRGEYRLPERAVLLTCDDGLLNCLTDMLPVLQQERVRCLFFVTGASAENSQRMLWYEELFLLLWHAAAGQFEISAQGVEFRGELGRRAQRRAIWWQVLKRLSRLDHVSRTTFLRALRIQLRLDAQQFFDDTDSPSSRRYRLLKATELRALASAGMSIGAHTLSHPMLSESPAEIAYTEISESRLKLESLLEQPVWAFAYPFGDPQSVTPAVLAMVQQAEYEAAFLNFGGGLGTGLPPYALPRIHVTAAMTLAEFQAHVSGFYARLQRQAGRSAKHISRMQASR